MPRKSNFTTDSEVPDDHFFDTFGNGVNRKISKSNLFKQIKKQAQTYYYDSEDDLKAAKLEADPDSPIYVRVAPSWRLYRITSLAPVAPYDIALNNGATATLDRLENLQFIDVNDMVNAPYLKTGDIVHTAWLDEFGDNGGNAYEIGVFGPADGVLIIDLALNGLQARRINIPIFDITYRVFNSKEDMESDPTLFVGQRVRTLGYNNIGDGGGNDYEIVASATGVDDGGSFIDLSGSGLQARGLFQNRKLNLRQFGAVGDGVSDDTSPAENLTQYAVSIGVNVAQAPVGTYAINKEAQISDVIWMGDGEFIGPLRDRVHREFESSLDCPSKINPKRHFRRFALSDTPVVVVMGDSLSTEDPTITFDESDSMWGVIQRRMEEDNPDLAIQFENRAIGGATWSSVNAASLLATGLTLPAWAGAGADPWLDYVEALQPDLLYLGFGMNDRQNFVTAQFRATLNKILGWAKVPDIVFVTNMVPSRMSANTNISSSESQEGRDFVAGYVRTWAEYQGFGYVDLNRQQVIKRDGFDPAQSSFERISGGARLDVSTPYQRPDSDFCADFGWDIVFNNIAADFWTGGGGGNLRFYLTPNFPNSRTFLDITDSGGFIKVEFVDVDDGPGRYLSVTSSVPTPGSGASPNLTIFVKGGYASIKLDDLVVYEGPFRRHGGQFSPSVEFTNGYAASMSLFFYRGSYSRYMPTIADYEMWGTASTGNTGGNNLNHPTSLGAATVYWPVFNKTDFRQPVVIEGTSDFPPISERKAGIGTPSPQGVFHVAKTESTATVAPNANNFVIEDLSNPGMSFISGDSGVVRVNFGDASDQDIGQISYVHSTDLMGFNAGNTRVLQFNSSVAQVIAPLRFQAENNSGVTDTANRSMSFDLTSNTNLRIRVKGNDGVVRVADLTLS